MDGIGRERSTTHGYEGIGLARSFVSSLLLLLANEWRKGNALVTVYHQLQLLHGARVFWRVDEVKFFRGFSLDAPRARHRVPLVRRGILGL